MAGLIVTCRFSYKKITIISFSIDMPITKKKRKKRKKRKAMVVENGKEKK